MKTIEHEGAVYVLKEDMETAIKDRIAKITSRAQTAEAELRSTRADLEKASASAGTTDVLAQQVEEFREQLQQANLRFDRYKAISQHGLVDEDMIEAVEWSYERAMKGVKNKDRVSLTDWLQGAVEDPSTAPAILRPHLTALKETTAAVDDTALVADDTAVAEQAAPRSERQQIPSVNNGATPPLDPPDLLSRASDPTFYEQNREAVQAAYRAKYMRR